MTDEELNAIEAGARRHETTLMGNTALSLVAEVRLANAQLTEAHQQRDACATELKLARAFADEQKTAADSMAARELVLLAAMQQVEEIACRNGLSSHPEEPPDPRNPDGEELALIARGALAGGTLEAHDAKVRAPLIRALVAQMGQHGAPWPKEVFEVLDTLGEQAKGRLDAERNESLEENDALAARVRELMAERNGADQRAAAYQRERDEARIERDGHKARAEQQLAKLDKADATICEQNSHMQTVQRERDELREKLANVEVWHGNGKNWLEKELAAARGSERAAVVRRFWALSQRGDMVIKFAGMIQAECNAICPDFETAGETLLEEYPAALWPDGPGGGPYLRQERERQREHAAAADEQRKRLGLPPFAWKYGRTGRS